MPSCNALHTQCHLSRLFGVAIMPCPVTVRLRLLFNFYCVGVCDLLLEFSNFCFKLQYLEFSGGREGFCVLCALRDHVERSLAAAGGVLSPLELVDNLNRILFDLCLMLF